MATGIGARRFSLSRLALNARAEARIAARAIPGIVWYVVPIIAWMVVSIGLGAVVGFAAVALPPVGAIGIVAAVAVVLLWVMPDVRLISPRIIRITFLTLLVVDLCTPYYYTIQVAGLPWISLHRVATFALIVPFLLAVAGSSEVRRDMLTRIRASWVLFTCAVGFLAMCVLSLPSSFLPSDFGLGPHRTDIELLHSIPGCDPCRQERGRRRFDFEDHLLQRGVRNRRRGFGIYS